MITRYNAARQIVLSAAFVTILSACVTSPVENPRAVWCETNQPFPKLPAVAVAMLSRAEKERLVTYQIRGEEWCGWK